MIGLEIKYDKIYTSDLRKIFENINLNGFKYQITEDEIIDNGSITINNLQDLFENYPNAFIFLLNLKLYKKINSSFEIKTYQDFKNSKCELLLLIVDSEYLEIYFQNKYLKKQILNNLKKYKITYKIKTLENDGRTHLSVF